MNPWIVKALDLIGLLGDLLHYTFSELGAHLIPAIQIHCTFNKYVLLLMKHRSDSK